MTPDTWKTIPGILASVAAILGALYGIVTMPMLRTLKAELGAMEARIDKRMVEMEARLNERIDTRLVHK